MRLLAISLRQNLIGLSSCASFAAVLRLTAGVAYVEDRSELLTPQQVAAMLQVSVGTVLRLLRSSRLRGVKLGRHWRVRPADLDAYLEGVTVRPPSDDIEQKPVAEAAPRGEGRRAVAAAGWKLAGAALLGLLLVQVALLSVLVLMAVGLKSSAADTDGSKAPSSVGGAATSEDPGTRRDAFHAPPTPTGSRAVAFVAEPTLFPTAQPSPSLTQPIQSPTPGGLAATPRTAVPVILMVGNTGGEGVYLRLAPGAGDRLAVWPDGTLAVVVGDDQEVADRLWKNVMDPRGVRGWMAAEYLVAPPSPAVDSRTRSDRKD